jgi:hypothetical protein
VTRYRPWLVPGILAAAAFVLLVMGAITWQMRSSPGHCPPHAACNVLGHTHRHHPLRAELMWVAAGLLAIVAVEAALMQRRLPHRRYHGHVSGRQRG